MDITREELIDSLSAGLETGIQDGNALAHYVIGRTSGLRLMERNTPQTVPAGVASASPWGFPETITTAAEAALDWPDGTLVEDKQGDSWERGDDSLYAPERRDGWVFEGYDKAGYVRLDDFLPAKVIRLGKGDN